MKRIAKVIGREVVIMYVIDSWWEGEWAAQTSGSWSYVLDALDRNAEFFVIYQLGEMS